MIIGIQFAHNNTKVIRGVLGYTKGNETALIEQTNATLSRRFVVYPNINTQLLYMFGFVIRIPHEIAGSPRVNALSVRPSVRPSKFVRKHFRSGTMT